jgi:hypothetical protein
MALHYVQRPPIDHISCVDLRIAYCGGAGCSKQSPIPLPLMPWPFHIIPFSLENGDLLLVTALGSGVHVTGTFCFCIDASGDMAPSLALPCQSTHPWIMQMPLILDESELGEAHAISCTALTLMWSWWYPVGDQKQYPMLAH